MINVVYNIGGGCVREDAKKVMSITAKSPKVENPKKSEDWETVNCIAVFLANEDTVYIFNHRGDSLEDCNDTIGMGTYELDLRLYNLFGAHTVKEFLGLREEGRRKVEWREDEEGNVLPVPVAETKARKKEEAAVRKKAARKASK